MNSEKNIVIITVPHGKCIDKIKRHCDRRAQQAVQNNVDFNIPFIRPKTYTDHNISL